jgi:hypothetical protein
MAAWMMVPEMKCELELYEYVLVRTRYVLFCPSTYLVSTIFPKYVLGTYWYVVCYKNIAMDAVLCLCLWETILYVRDMYVVVLQY